MSQKGQKKKINYELSTTNYQLTIGWLYPDLMSIYGDRGNIIVLQKRCEWRDINVTIKEITLDSSAKDLQQCDLLMMGGAQDSQQTIVAKDLQKKKSVLSEMIESEIPGLYICGGFQYLGKYYKEADGTVIEQLGILDMYTENPGGRRLIGNIAIKIEDSRFKIQDYIVGFENHGGRTILGKGIEPLGKVIRGYGSNDEAKEEGAVYKNSIGTYFHGPILPKNPELADWLIVKALEKKYKKNFVIASETKQSHQIEIATSQAPRDDVIMLPSLDDTLAFKARNAVLSRLGL